MSAAKIEACIATVREAFGGVSGAELIDGLNKIRSALHEMSPFASEPVDCVLWVQSDHVQANDYNPNSVAKVEMSLLATSILHDGYTQPVVTIWDDEKQNAAYSAPSSNVRVWAARPASTCSPSA